MLYLNDLEQEILKNPPKNILQCEIYLKRIKEDRNYHQIAYLCEMINMIKSGLEAAGKRYNE